MTSKPRTIVLVSSVVAILVAAVLLLRGGHSGAIVSASAPASMPAASHPANHPNGTQRSSRALPEGEAGNNTGTVEVCGYRPVPIDRNDASSVFQQVGALTKGAGRRWLSVLQNSDDLRARVAGLLLEGKVTGGEALQPTSEQTRNEVVQLAAGTGDPAVYAMALFMCGSSAVTDAASACRELSLQHWARMDADNAVPWLLLAGRARSRHDYAAEADAFSHAAASHKIDSYSDSVFASAEPQLPQDITPLQRAYLATEVIGVEAAIGLPQYSAASQHCSGDAMQDRMVRQQCDSVAELLVSKGSNLVDLSVGKAIGARAGWPSKRVDEVSQEQHALMQALMQQTPSDNDTLWTCDAVSRLNAYMVQRVRLGEVGATRELLERSGETIEVMARRYTQYLDKLKRDALEQGQQKSLEIAPAVGKP
jgi:hypothetical protein